MPEKSRKEIPVFFATDDNYAPFLSVSLTSMLANSSKDYIYRIFVLTTSLNTEYEKKLQENLPENATIEFISLKNELDKIQGMFFLRDYYSKETYYRFFIANLFPNYDKVLYLDCDIIVLGDISELYNVELGNNLVAAAPEEVMGEVKVFGDYVEQTLDIKTKNYFNAGILLMNTKLFRKERIAEKFVDLLNKYKFTVTQDQDYLNVLCKGRVNYVDLGWNKTAFKNVKFNDKDLKIIHYKMNWKPWHYDGVEYEKQFWHYAEKTGFYNYINDVKSNYSEDQKKKDNLAYNRLVEQAIHDSNDPNNYKNTVNKYTPKTIFQKIVRFNYLKSIKNLIGIKGHKSVYGSRKK